MYRFEIAEFHTIPIETHRIEKEFSNDGPGSGAYLRRTHTRPAARTTMGHLLLSTNNEKEDTQDDKVLSLGTRN